MQIFTAAVFAALGNWCSANSYNHLPVGIASALNMSFASIAVVAIGYFFPGESLSSYQLLFVGLILIGVIGLGASRSIGTLPVNFHVGRGLFNSFMFGILLACAYVFIGIVSRELDPFIAGYLWELTIGVVAAAFALMRSCATSHRFVRVSRLQFFRILLFSAPTVLGTGCYTLAMTMGSIGIATALVSTMMVFSALIAHFIYGERLSSKQIFILGFICAMVVGLKLAPA